MPFSCWLFILVRLFLRVIRDFRVSVFIMTPLILWERKLQPSLNSLVWIPLLDSDLTETMLLYFWYNVLSSPSSPALHGASAVYLGLMYFSLAQASREGDFFCLFVFSIWFLVSGYFPLSEPTHMEVLNAQTLKHFLYLLILIEQITFQAILFASMQYLAIDE